MENLTPEARAIVEDIASRNAVSNEAVVTLLMALVEGQGTQAQFSHPELGGMGQWSQGGMTMVGDMFNQGLKFKVDSLCSELSQLVRSDQVLRARPTASSQSQSQGSGQSGVSLFVAGAGPSSQWWPADLENPSSVGAQNNLRYAFFPSSRRLAIDIAGTVKVYDTLDHQITGFSQQQSGDQSLTFTSQHGLVAVSSLRGVKDDQEAHPPAPEAQPTKPVEPVKPPAAPEQDRAPTEAQAETIPTAKSKPVADPAEDIFAKIERLAELHEKKILTQQEFEAKKAELLDRI